MIKIDQAAGKITIKHGPLKQFEMDEGMTMVYRADNPAMLKNIRVSDKIKFAADRANGQFTVTRVEKARSVAEAHRTRVRCQSEQIFNTQQLIFSAPSLAARPTGSNVH